MMLVALTIAGCTGSGDVERSGTAAQASPATRTGLDEPCPDGVTLALGAPFRGRDYAKFRAAGGPVYVSVRQFSDGDTAGAGTGEATVYVGLLARPPTYDREADRVRGTIATAAVLGGTWSAIDLAEGWYWLTVADGWDVVIRSCEPDGVRDGSDFDPGSV